MTHANEPIDRDDAPPSGLHICPAELADLAAICRLRTASDIADFGEPLLSEEQLAANWRAAGFNLAHDTWVAWDSIGQAIGYAEARCGSGQVSIRVAVPPAWRGHGLGRWLLARAEARAVASGATRALCQIGGRNAAAQHLLTRAGYTNEVTFRIMAITLTGPPEATIWPSGITVQPFVAGRDEKATYTADEEASVDKGYFRPLSFEEWAARMGLARIDPGLWFLAWDGEQVAGVALNYVAAATGIGWVDHLGVRRPWRGRGLGAALLQHSFGAFYRRGVREVRLSVDDQSRTNATHLYERAGMATIQQYHVFTKELA